MRVFTALVLGTAILAPAPTWAQASAATKASAVHTKAAVKLPAPVKITSVEGITEYRLGNGLRVLLFPDASQPSMTVNITYLVGSRNEIYGETGMAHLLEHLMFKPSKNFSGADKAHPNPVTVLNGLGATFNGSTLYDRTNYFTTFPANEANLHAALALEADRMVNADIAQSDLWNDKTQKGEMSVVRNEFESGENNPIRVTAQRDQAVAYDWHNYGKDTIGARSDVEHVNIAHLQAFYHKYYQPDNAVLMVAGKIDEAKVLSQVNDLLGRIPKPKREIEKQWTVEPTQDGERSVTIRRVGGVPVLVAGYHVSATSNPDAGALEVVDRILTAAPGGRLYKALVESKLATQVGSNTVSTLDPSFYQILAILPKDGDAEKAKAAMLSTLEDLKAHPFTQEELDRAKAEIAKYYDLTSTKTDQLATSLSESMAAGDWRLYFLNRDRGQALTLAQAQAFAEHYLKAANRTLGEYIPTEKPDRSEIPAVGDIAAMVDGYKGRAPEAKGETFDASPANMDARTVRFTTPNGLKGALLSKKTKGGSVSASFTLHLGTGQSLMNQGAVPSLAAQMLLRGTTELNRQQIQDRLDKLKANVNISGNAEAVQVNILTIRENLPATLKVVAEALQHPSFPADEVQKLVDERVSGIQQQESEPTFLAVNAIRRATDPYPAGHLRHANTPAEDIAQLKAATLDQMKAFHDTFYGAQAADFSAVGDFDAEATKALVTELFGSWTAQKPYERIPSLMKVGKGLEQSIEAPDKANAFFIAGEPMAIQDTDADYPAMLMANYILGGGALKNRLADRIRQKEGISYGVGSQFAADAWDKVASWTAYAIYAPQNVDRLLTAFQEELARAIKDGFTADELAFAKHAWLQGQAVDRTEDGGVARDLAAYLPLGRTFAYDAGLEKQVDSLTVDQVNAALRKYLDPSKLTIVKAGDFAKAAKK
ncbi:MAG TPA: pitrilysin family protein [Holophagaceae bacterium]|nr:pitrilysin family protein [Holophagaceae bacterium]